MTVREVLTPPSSTKLRAAVPHRTMDEDDDHPAQLPFQPQRTTAVRRPDAPPRNEQGDFCCTHQECEESPQTFKRACEWNKHMDRHERPYKCDHPNCINSQGFTYSGGLLRHQREVHRMHQSANKSRIFCPYPGCPRNSSGEGFSRKENLEEHKRRRHAEEKTPSLMDDEAAQDRKRKRPPTPVPSDYSVKADGIDYDANGDEFVHVGMVTRPSAVVDEDHPLVKRLRAELQQCQDRLHQALNQNHALRGQLQQCYQLMQNFPTPQIYAVGQGNQASRRHGALVSPQMQHPQYINNAGSMIQSAHLDGMMGSAYKK